MNSVTAVGCMVVQGYVNGLGVASTAAYSACSKFLNLFMLPAVTTGMSIAAFVSQNYGAGRTDRIRAGIRVCMTIVLVSYALFSTVMCLFPNTLAGFLLNEGETITLAAQYLKICGAMLILVNFLFVFRSSVQGMGHPFIPMCSGVVEMGFRILVMACFLSKYGFNAVAYADAVAWSGVCRKIFSACLTFFSKCDILNV